MTDFPGPAAFDAAGPVVVSTLRKRPDFLRAARAARQSRPGFTLQARERRPDEPATGLRVGYTCSKKVGNAVARNRAKRRLRALAREVFPTRGRAGWDYVLIGRPGRRGSREAPAMSPMARVAAVPVRAYKLVISPFIGANCRYQPTCSVYALEALERHGALKGGWLAVRRMARCHPWGGSGIDNVPE